MIVLAIHRLSQDRFKATIQLDGATHELFLTVEDFDDIQTFRITEGAAEPRFLIQHTGYCNLFWKAFSKFLKGRNQAFPIDLTPPEETRSKAAGA